MNTNTHFKQQGIGLVEVLIALVVVSLGLLGLAKLEGNLLSTSGHNKARAEAIGIAQQQMETIRYAASSQTAFEDLDDAGLSLVNLNPFAVTGTNAQFTVDIDIEDPDANQIINTIVDVAWTDATGAADSVTLMSEIALQDVQKSALNTNDSAAATAVPSPRQSASEDVQAASETIDPNDVISPTETPLPATGTVLADATRASGLAETFTVNSTDTVPVTYTLTAIANDSRYYNTYFGDGNLAVYVCESTLAGGCRYIQNHFGGVSLSASGYIYSAKNYGIGPGANDNDLSGVTPVWSSSEVTACYKGPVVDSFDSEGDEVFTMEYECVYAGNCEDDATTCYGYGTATAVTPAQVIDKGVGPGGEFGNLGMIGLDGSSGGDQVCFLEDTPDITADSQNEALLNGNLGPNPKPQYNEAYLLPVTTRSYVTRRLLSNGEERSEGINQSFRNHNFLLTNRTTADDEDNCHLAVNLDPTAYVLAPRTISRVRTDTGASVQNPVVATSTFPLNSMPAITVSTSVSLVTDERVPNLYIPEVGSCYVNKDTKTTYACVVPNTYTSNVTIYGASNKVPTPTAADPAVPVVYDDCTFDVDTNEVGNINTDGLVLGVAQPLALQTRCRWSADF